MNAWRYEPAHDLLEPPVNRWRSTSREAGLISTIMHLTTWGAIRTYLSAMHRMRVSGRENLPSQTPFVLVANHTSHLDALALAAPLPWRLRDRIFPLAAGDVFFDQDWKAALSATCLNAMPIWRRQCTPRSLQELRRRLIEEPCGYIIFPEGARSRTGEMKPFRSGIGMLIAATNVPVIPCHLNGCFESLAPGQRIPTPMRIQVTYGEPMKFSGIEDDRSGWNSIATRLELAVRDLEAKNKDAGIRASGTRIPAPISAQ